ncbi:hypothetical protein ABZV14_13445 [Streptosporangium canum]
MLEKPANPEAVQVSSLASIGTTAVVVALGLGLAVRGLTGAV